MVSRESDHLIVLRVRESLTHGEAGDNEHTFSRETWPRFNAREGPLFNERIAPAVITGLEKIANKAQLEPKLQFTSLAHHLTPDSLLKSLKRLPGQTGRGVDKESKEEALQSFQDWCPGLLNDVHKLGHKPPPVKRVFIPKPGKEEKRPIGVPTVKDRALQHSVANILSSIYEQDFLDVSFGGRRKRNAHQAVARVCKRVTDQKTSWVLEADLKNFFGSLDHGWMVKFLELRIGDPRILRLIQRWLKAGVMEGNEYSDSTEGVPQGGSISVVLSNVYLHYVLDLWFEKRVKPQLTGESHLIRYLDDFVICFQNRKDAIRVRNALESRLTKFSLSLEPSKTRVVPFGRFAHKQYESNGFRKPPTLSFLGFVLYGARAPWGHFVVIPKAQANRVRRFLLRVKIWMQDHRHTPLRHQWKQIMIRYRGFVNYFGVVLSSPLVKSLCRQITRMWKKQLSRRSQRGSLNWVQMHQILKHFPIRCPKLALPSAKWTQLQISQEVH